MTPTLLGRWQSRLILMSTIGVLVTIFFALTAVEPLTPFVILGYVTLLGLGWDVIYNYLLRHRWERDWPPIFFVFAAIAEGILMWGIIQLGLLPGLGPGLRLDGFISHYAAVWLATFLFMLAPLRLIHLRWRFWGGEFYQR